MILAEAALEGVPSFITCLEIEGSELRFGVRINPLDEILNVVE
jgi:hypothetical protein